MGLRNRSGSVLILAMWALFLLGSLALVVGGRAGSSIEMARHLKSGVFGYRAAVSGVEFSIINLLSDTNGWDSLDEDWASSSAFEGTSIGESSFHVVSEGVDSLVRYGLDDEQARVNVNRASSNLLVSILVTAGELSEGSAESIVGGIEEYRKRKAFELLTEKELNGYDARNADSSADLQSVYELLRIRGMEGVVFERISPFITVFGDGRVNLNTASETVLLALARSVEGDDGKAGFSLTEKIMAFRSAGGYFSGRSLSAIREQLGEKVEIRGAESSLLVRMLRHATVSSSCFRGRVYGVYLPNAGDTVDDYDAVIEFVYDRKNKKKLFWNEG